jgi:hypothetical protein
MDLALGLHYAGNLADTPQGRRQYKAYLAWLQEDNAMKRRLQFSSLCRGWALGSKTFKEELVEKFLPVGSVRHLEGGDLQEANQVRWETMIKACMISLGKTKADVQSDRKAALWKVMIAYFMKEHSSVSNVWLAKYLNMGVPQGVSRSVGIFQRSNGPKQKPYIKMLRITTP